MIRRVLLLEDSMLIALDTQDVLRECGVSDIALAANVAQALAALGEGMPDFAVLDFNLGDETSEPVALALDAAGVPYCFATGYGDALDRITVAPPYGVLKKPYSQDQIHALLARVALDRAAG
jgi:DNA-binding NtrC family response regulator